MEMFYVKAWNFFSDMFYVTLTKCIIKAFVESSPWIYGSEFDDDIGVNLSAAHRRSVPVVDRNTDVDVSLVVDINLYTAFENSFHLCSWTIAMKCQGHYYNGAVLLGGVARRSNFRHTGKDCYMGITLEKGLL